jgi:hypothetical protein
LPSNPAGALLAGLLDVVFTTRPVHGEHVECVQLPNLPMALFCSEALANEELSPAGCWFVVPPADQHCPEADGWPGDAARSIAAFIDGVWPRLLACASSKWVTAAPNVPAVRSYAEALGLKVVGADQLRPISVFASHRTSLAGSGRVEAVVECVRVQLDRAAPSTRPSFVGE